ncbi:MAG: N-acetyltransferase family protein [Thermoguttaceae bacterium]
MQARCPDPETGKPFLQTIRQTWRSYGLGVAFCELAYRLARRLTNVRIAQVLQLDLSAMRPAKPRALDLECRFLSAAEVRAAAADPAHELDAAMAERLQSGRDLCFAAFHGDRLVNYSWYALGAIEPEHGFGAGLTFPFDTVYLYKAYTVPAYRGRQIHGSALQQAVQFFQQCGIKQLIAIVEFANWASLRSHEKLGCRPAGRLLRIGQKSWGWGCGSLLQGQPCR